METLILLFSGNLCIILTVLTTFLQYISSSKLVVDISPHTPGSIEGHQLGKVVL